MRVTIKNWRKFNPRTDVKRPSWFRVEYSLLEDPDFYEFSHAEFMAWFYIMAQACRKNTDTITVNYLHAEKMMRLSVRDVNGAIEKLCHIGIIECDPPIKSNITERARYASDTATNATERDGTERDGTRRDGTERVSPGLAPPDEAEQPNLLIPEIADREPPARGVKKKSDRVSKTGPVWDAYRDAFQLRYKTEPIRNATVNAILSKFVDRVPAEQAPSIAAFYVRHNGQFYVGKMHPVNLMLQDAEKLAAEHARGQQITSAEARAADRKQSNVNAWSIALQKNQERKNGV